MKKINLFIYCLSLPLLAVISCNSKENSSENDTITQVGELNISYTEEQFKTSGMELGTIIMNNFSETIVTNGKIDVPPANRANVSAVLGGFIKNLPLLVGDNVKKGQFIASIENPDFIKLQQEYLELNEALTYLKSEFTRQKTLFDEKITSEKNYLKAESEYKATLAKRNGLAQQLKMVNIDLVALNNGTIVSSVPIYAPISGSISMVNVNVGEFVNASNTILEIIDNTHKHLELVVFEKDVLHVKKGQKIEFQLPESSDVKFDAEVHLIGQTIDNETRTAQVHGHLISDNEQFLVGMFVEAEIIIKSKLKPALPNTALIIEEGITSVMVLTEKNENGYNFEKVAVEIGLKDDNYVEIKNTSQIKEGSQVLVKGIF
jgi:cobalt-zinc-cadmium efflux system membrane fusion protein